MYFSADSTALRFEDESNAFAAFAFEKQTIDAPHHFKHEAHARFQCDPRGNSQFCGGARSVTCGRDLSSSLIVNSSSPIIQHLQHSLSEFSKSASRPFETAFGHSVRMVARFGRFYFLNVSDDHIASPSISPDSLRNALRDSNRVVRLVCLNDILANADRLLKPNTADSIPVEACEKPAEKVAQKEPRSDIPRAKRPKKVNTPSMKSSLRTCWPAQAVVSLLAFLAGLGFEEAPLLYANTHSVTFVLGREFHLTLGPAMQPLSFGCRPLR